jgi:transcriptional regulator with XRE-family HTH domain
MRTHKLDNYLRTHRKRSGFSQETLSYLLGAESGTKISRYESNDRVPSFDTILALVAVFGAPMEELFAGRFGKVRTKVRRRAAFLRRRLAAHPQSHATRRQLESLSKISRHPR